MRRGSGARRIVDFHNDERLAGNVRDRLIEFGHNGFGLNVVRYCGPGDSDGGANGSDGGADLHGLLLGWQTLGLRARPVWTVTEIEIRCNHRVLRRELRIRPKGGPAVDQRRTRRMQMDDNDYF